MITLTPRQLQQLVGLRGDVASAWLSHLGGYSEFAKGLDSSTTEGILGTREDIENRRKMFGTNKLTMPKIPSFGRLLTKSATDIPLLILLIITIATAVITLIDMINSALYDERVMLGDIRWSHPWADEIAVVIGIVLIIFCSAMMDHIKYSHITWILDVIEKIHRVRVIRDGKESILSTSEVVVGDLCLLKMGDVIPADGVVAESYDLKVEDNRISGGIPCMQKGPSDPIVNAGTVVIEGTGRMIVASVGTPLHGHVSPYGNVKGSWRKKYIFQKLIEIDKKKEKLLSYTDLQNKVFRFSTELTFLGGFMAFLILAVPMTQTLIHIYLFNNEWTVEAILHSTEFVATAVVALAIMVPKSLPLIPTLSLAYSLKKMVNDKILLHHFDTYETMGNISVICTDKTGSLTIDRYPKLWKSGDIQNSFETKWNCPSCCGALDGKHIAMKRPPGSCGEFYNYKGGYSIILSALVDAVCKFIYVDVGTNGRAKDGSVFRLSTLKKAIDKNSLNLPQDYIIVADDAFPLSTNLMKPFSRRNLSLEERIYNYRLSRARRVAENAFGILAARFRVFRKEIEVNLSTVYLIVQAACAIHNWLRTVSPGSYYERGWAYYEDTETGVLHPGLWRTAGAELPSISSVRTANTYSKQASERRSKMAAYFNKEGQVPWQMKAIGM